METINAIEALTPYLNGCSFYAEKYNQRHYCLNMTKEISPLGVEEILIHQDFFTCIGFIDSKWEADVEGNTFLLHAPLESEIKIELVDTDTKIPQTVEWKPELKLLNFVNKELWEEELVREIAGVTYYPLNLFRFKDRLTVFRSIQMRLFMKDFDVFHKRYTKTLYYYIKDGRLYMGLWNYELRMPENPFRLCKIDEKYSQI